METQVLLSGLRFGEGPRWRDGLLWFSDFYRRGVYTVDESGVESLVVEVPGQPSGLGWLPDGSLLIVSMTNRQVLRWDGSTLSFYADVSDIATFHANDMIVDASGRAYVGNFGFDLHAAMLEREVPEILADNSAGNTSLIRVDPDGSVHEAADDVRFPNGMVLLDGGRTLVVAETLRLQLTAFDVAEGWIAVQSAGMGIDRRAGRCPRMGSAPMDRPSGPPPRSLPWWSVTAKAAKWWERSTRNRSPTHAL